MSIRIREFNEDKVLRMRDLKPLQVAIITEAGVHKGHIVMRTASISGFEVMDLSNPGPDYCWGSGCDVDVSLLQGTLTLELSND